MDIRSKVAAYVAGIAAALTVAALAAPHVTAAYVIAYTLITGDYPGDMGSAVTEDSAIIDAVFAARGQ